MSITVSDCANACLYLEDACLQFVFGNGNCYLENKCLNLTSSCDGYDRYVMKGKLRD
jgi:hypothetical protein